MLHIHDGTGSPQAVTLTSIPTVDFGRGLQPPKFGRLCKRQVDSDHRCSPRPAGCSRQHRLCEVSPPDTTTYELSLGWYRVILVGVVGQLGRLDASNVGILVLLGLACCSPPEDAKP